MAPSVLTTRESIVYCGENFVKTLATLIFANSENIVANSIS